MTKQALSLRTAQTWGVATKIITAALSIAQTAIVLRLLSPAEYGIIGIVLSIGSLVGVTQHMGIVDATIREIAVASDAKRRAHVFWASIWIRLIMTVPVAAALILFASYIGTRIYPLPGVTELVRIMAVVLIVQGIQGVLGGIFTGRLAFRRLYVFQLLMGVINVPVFGLLVWYRGIGGYFEAMVITTTLFLILLATYARSILGSLHHPSLEEMKNIIRLMFHTSAWTYVAKLLSVAWQRLPILILGLLTSPDVVGLFNVAVTFGSKIVFVLGIGEVNLAYLSATFARKLDEFRQMAQKTLNEIAAAVVLGAGFLALFAPELLRVFAGEQYVPAVRVVVVVTWAYALYVFLDIASHTVFVPARASHLRAYGFAVLLATTVISFFLIPTEPLMAAGLSVLLGAAAGVIFGSVVSKIQLQISLVSARLWAMAGVATILVIASRTGLVIEARIALFILIGGIIAWIGFGEVIRNLYTRWIPRNA